MSSASAIVWFCAFLHAVSTEIVSEEIAVTSSAKQEEDDGECGGHPVLVSRSQWRARKPGRVYPMRLPVSHVIILHTATEFCSTKARCARMLTFFQDEHIDEKGYWDLGYSFVIGGDGRVYVGHGFNETGAHTINYNTKSIGVAFIGDFRKVAPTKVMLDAAQELIECGIRKGYLTPVVEVNGHRDVSCSLAPGDALYSIIRTWKRYKGGRLREFDCSGF